MDRGPDLSAALMMPPSVSRVGSLELKKDHMDLVNGPITPTTSGTIVSISGCNSVKSGGPTSISQHNPSRKPDGKFGVFGARVMDAWRRFSDSLL